MNIDLLPFSAFALESCAQPASVPGEAQTLTLQLHIAPVRLRAVSMAGIAVANRAFADRPNALRASVVPADGSALVITFQ